MSPSLNPIKTLKILISIIIFLLCMNIMGITSKFYLDHDYVYGLIPLFDFDTEFNIPSLFSTILLISSSTLLLNITLKHKKNNNLYNSWAILSIIFLYLSMDELLSIHEMIEDPIRELFNISDVLYYAWVIPYGLLLVLFVASYMKFLIRLPNKTSTLMLVSGSIFITGALGFELLEARLAANVGINNLLYSIYYTIEETLEMFGITLFIYTLLTYTINQFYSSSKTDTSKPSISFNKT